MRDLWIAKVTGHRRRGTRAAELREIFHDKIRVSVIQESLCACYEDASADEVADLAKQLDFDVLGIRPPDVDVVDGYVCVAELNGNSPCTTFRKHFHPTDLISDSTPLVGLLELLVKKPHLFVVTGNHIAGIVTRADLQKPPVRLLVFGWITLLEMHLVHLVDRFYPDDSWQEKLRAPRLQSAEKLLEERRERNEEIRLLDCLQFCDNRELVLASEPCRDWLGLRSKKNGRRVLRQLEKLRDRVAHSQDLIAGTCWEEVIPGLLEAERMVLRSDELAEQQPA